VTDVLDRASVVNGDNINATHIIVHCLVVMIVHDACDTCIAQGGVPCICMASKSWHESACMFIVCKAPAGSVPYTLPPSKEIKRMYLEPQYTSVVTSSSEPIYHRIEEAAPLVLVFKGPVYRTEKILKTEPNQTDMN